MTLGDKIRCLRGIEGTLRGLGREMTQQEVVSVMKTTLRRTISQSYLSQIESGARPHVTGATRALLAQFFKVHPGYLVDDPEGFQTGLSSALEAEEHQLDQWLTEGAERFRRDPEVSAALHRIANQPDSRRCLLLLEGVLDTPDLMERLLAILRPDAAGKSLP